MRAAIRGIPDGSYRSVVEVDGLDHAPTRIVCEIRKAQSGIVIDYTGTSPQVDRGINCVLNYTRAYSVYPLKCAIDVSRRRNSGTYRPIQVIAPAGSLLNPRVPAPVFGRHLTGHVLSCSIYQALANVLPASIIADSGGAPALRAGVSGALPDGSRFVQLLFASAGMGASSHSDGLSTTAFPTNSGAGSIEAMEAVSPLLFLQKEFRVDSGGAGTFRGGLGQIIGIENISGRPVGLGLVGDRESHPALGLQGGLPGATASASRGIEQEPLRLKSQTMIPAGETLLINFPGGGGFGAPAKRDPAAIAADLLAGFISPEAAQRDYSKGTK